MPRDDDPAVAGESEPDAAPHADAEPGIPEPDAVAVAPAEPWWTTPMASSWPPAATQVRAPRSPVAGAASADDVATETETETDAVDAAAPALTDVDAATEIIPADATGPEPATAVMPAPLAPAPLPAPLAPAPLQAPIVRTHPVAASEAAPVSALRHSSGRRVGVDAQRPRRLVWMLAGIVVVVVLVGLFFVGQRLGSGVPVAVATSTPTPSVTPTATPTPTPSPTAVAEVTAMQPAGVHAWDALFGGECLEPYDSPWSEEFTVVDCATAHTAQLVFRGSLGDDVAMVFPGEAELAAQMSVLCSADGLIDLSAAAALADVQVQGSYPVTDEQWNAGERRYHCFVSRSSGEPLTASLAGPGPTA